MAVATIARENWQATGEDGLLDLEGTVANIRKCLTILQESTR